MIAQGWERRPPGLGIWAHVEAESGSQWQSIHMFFSPADMDMLFMDMDMPVAVDMCMVCCAWAWTWGMDMDRVFSPAAPLVEVVRVQV